MLKRVVLIALFLMIPAWGLAVQPAEAPHFQSSFLRVELAPKQPNFTFLAVDSLGKRKLDRNPLRSPAAPAKTYEVRHIGQRYEYRAVGAPASAPVCKGVNACAGTRSEVARFPPNSPAVLYPQPHRLPS